MNCLIKKFMYILQKKIKQLLDKVKDILNGNTDEILRGTGYDKRHDSHEIVEYYGKIIKTVTLYICMMLLNLKNIYH